MNTRKINEIEMHQKNSWLIDANYTLAQQADIYDKQLQHVYDNPGLYLDNLNYLREYRVSWKDYRSTHPTVPHKYTKKQKPTTPL